MEQAQQYAIMAGKAAEKKEHVAAVVYHGLSALLATSVEESTRNVEALIDYGSIPKKPIDQLATYEWAHYIVAIRSLGGALDTRVQLLKGKIDLEDDKNATTP